MEQKDLKNFVLFRDLSDEEINLALSELQVREKQYKKDAVVLAAGNTTEWMGLVLEGSVTIECPQTIS